MVASRALDGLFAKLRSIVFFLSRRLSSTVAQIVRVLFPHIRLITETLPSSVHAREIVLASQPPPDGSMIPSLAVLLGIGPGDMSSETIQSLASKVSRWVLLVTEGTLLSPFPENTQIYDYHVKKERATQLAVSTRVVGLSLPQQHLRDSLLKELEERWTDAVSPADCLHGLFLVSRYVDRLVVAPHTPCVTPPITYRFASSFTVVSPGRVGCGCLRRRRPTRAFSPPSSASSLTSHTRY